MIKFITIFTESAICNVLGLRFAVSVFICVLQTPDLQTTDWVQVCLSVQCIYTTRPALYKQKPKYLFEMNTIISRPHLDMSKKTKVKADTKLTVVMCCQIFDRKSVSAIFGNDWRRGRPVDKIRNFEEKKLLKI